MCESPSSGRPGAQGVDNVYTQHTPLLTETVAALAADRLDPLAYPYMAATGEEAAVMAANAKRAPPREVRADAGGVCRFGRVTRNRTRDAWRDFASV
jgi:hypothetical protein